MNKELKLFYEDAQEQLTFMEDALITMQESGVEDESIGALFRAMHTIKGTAGMFGFDDVVHFTHIAENLLSEVRDGNVKLDDDMIDTFLEAKDHSLNLVDLAIENESLDEPTKELNDKLIKYFHSKMPNANINKTEDTQVLANNTAETAEILWHISFRLKTNFFKTGMDIANLLSFFNILGKVDKVVLVDANIPTLDTLKPLDGYLGYEIEFTSEASYADIEEIFEFVIEDIELHIFKANDTDMLKTLLEKYKDENLKDLLISNDFTALKKLDADKKVVVKKTKENTSSKKPQKKEKEKSFSLRVDSSKIDQLINQISEMVIENARISQRADDLDDTDLNESAIIMTDMLEEIRTGIMNIRMVQVGDSFNKFKRIVHDVAKKVHKEINFEIIGGDTELDKMVVEKISDPLMHMLRNSIDHGIEMPDDREKLGKSRVGKVTLTIYPDAGTIVIEIRDDGKGLPKDKILTKAITNGLIKDGENLSDKEIYALIFEAGLSTAEEVSDISGRGVGMDVVKRNIESLRGTVEIDSRDGEGSLFVIRLPLTLAIIDGFLVQSGDTKYIIPLEMIQECIELDATYKTQMHGNEFINLRDSMLPLLNIREYFNESKSKTTRENVVVVRYGEHKMGIKVDELFGEFQTVIKPLGKVFKKVPGISGGTILGSGEIAIIFDIPKLIAHRLKDIKK